MWDWRFAYHVSFWVLPAVEPEGTYATQPPPTLSAGHPLTQQPSLEDGLHEAALAAGVPPPLDSSRAERALGTGLWSPERWLAHPRGLGCGRRRKPGKAAAHRTGSHEWRPRTRVVRGASIVQCEHDTRARATFTSRQARARHSETARAKRERERACACAVNQAKRRQNCY